MFKCALLTEENTVAMTYTIVWEVSKAILKLIKIYYYIHYTVPPN